MPQGTEAALFLLRKPAEAGEEGSVESEKSAQINEKYFVCFHEDKRTFILLLKLLTRNSRNFREVSALADGKVALILYLG